MRSSPADRPIAPTGPAPAAIDARWAELALACLVTGAAAIVLPPRFVMVPSLFAPALALYAAALLRRWSATGRLAAFLLLLAVIGVAPTVLMLDASATGSPGLAHDGGVLVTGMAVEELLAGHDPYTAPMADHRLGHLVIDGLLTDNPIRGHYPYSPGAFLLQLPLMAPMLALGLSPDARWLYLAVYAALAVGFGRWSLRERGELLVPLLLLASPVFLPFLWHGETDVLLVAGLVGLACALTRQRPLPGALALGMALSTKLLLAPFALVFLAWLLAGVRHRRVHRSAAIRAATVLALPSAVTMAPFLLWHPGAMLEDVLLFHAGLAPPRYPILGAGFPAFLFDVDVIHDRWAAAPWWSTVLPTAVALAGAVLWVWWRTRVRDLLVAGAAASLAAVYFSRAFTVTYWWLPMTLLSLAAVAERASRPAK